MSSTSRSPEELLASINSISKQILVCTESHLDKLPPRTKCHPIAPPESILLPEPPSLLAPLLEAGAPQHLAQEMHTIYLERASQLRSRYTAVISRLLKDLPPLPIDGVDTFSDQLTPLFLSTYAKTLQDWVSDAIDMFRGRRLPDHKAASQPFNQTFNHDYVPLLERFFDKNPFPTRADKAFLAKKSGMTFQQIHVWFQNRRSRSRKVGKVLRKRTVSEGTTLPLDSSQVCTNVCVTKPVETIDDESCCGQPKKLVPVSQSLDQCAGIKLDCSTQIALKVDPNWWSRRPSLAKPRRSSFDMDRLAEKFSQLSVRDRTSGRGKRHQDGLRDPLAVTSFVTVTPSPAPHPALIRTRNVPSLPLPPLVVPRTSASRSARLRAFNAPYSSRSLDLSSSVVSDFPKSPREGQQVISKESTPRIISSVCETQPTVECGVASSRTPQRALHSIPMLSSDTTRDCVIKRNGSSWVFPVGYHSLATVRALSQHAIAPWDFRPAVAV